MRETIASILSVVLAVGTLTVIMDWKNGARHIVLLTSFLLCLIWSIGLAVGTTALFILAVSVGSPTPVAMTFLLLTVSVAFGMVRSAMKALDILVTNEKRK